MNEKIKEQLDIKIGEHFHLSNQLAAMENAGKANTAQFRQAVKRFERLSGEIMALSRELRRQPVEPRPLVKFFGLESAMLP